MTTVFDPEIIYVTKSEYKEGWGFKEHFHDYYQLITVCLGICTVTINGENHLLFEGCSALIGKNVPHSLLTEKNERCIVVDIKFLLHKGEERLNGFLGIHATPGGFIGSMDYIASEAVNKQPLFKEIIDCRLTELLMILTRPREAALLYSPAEVYSYELSGIAATVAKYIEDNHARSFTLDELSEALGYSKIYLCQSFKRQTGKGIFAYLYDVRLRHALKLLRDTDLSQEQIISLTGFKTINHLSKYCKQQYGVSPGKIRRQMKKVIDIPVLLSAQYETDLRQDNRAYMIIDEQEKES